VTVRPGKLGDRAAEPAATASDVEDALAWLDVQEAEKAFCLALRGRRCSVALQSFEQRLIEVEHRSHRLTGT